MKIKVGTKVIILPKPAIPSAWVGILGVVESKRNNGYYIQFKNPYFNKIDLTYFSKDEIKIFNSAIVKQRLGVK